VVQSGSKRGRRSDARRCAVLESLSGGIRSRGEQSSVSAANSRLVGLKDRKYFDHTGLHLHRSIADLMRHAVLASGLEALRKYGDFITGGDNDHKDLPAPTRLLRFTDEQLYALALYIYSLDYPVNPNWPDSLSAKGETIFKREACVGCHTPPLYTNNKLIPVDGFIVPFC
jgi:hypothetical protein